MLLLTRKLGESIRIADVVQVKVIEVRGDSITLGIAAPKEIEVHREEVWRRSQIKRAERVASVVNSASPAGSAEPHSQNV